MNTFVDGVHPGAVVNGSGAGDAKWQYFFIWISTFPGTIVPVLKSGRQGFIWFPLLFLSMFCLFIPERGKRLSAVGKIFYSTNTNPAHPYGSTPASRNCFCAARNASGIAIFSSSHFR